MQFPCKTAYKKWTNRDERVSTVVIIKLLDEKLSTQEPNFMRHHLLSIDKMSQIYTVNILVCQPTVTHTSNVRL